MSTPRAAIVVPTLDAQKAVFATHFARASAGVPCAVVIVQDHERRGGIAPANAGFEAALELGAPFVVYLNDDAGGFQYGWLARMIEALEENPRNGIACPSGGCRGGEQGKVAPGAPRATVVVDQPLAWFVAVLRREMLAHVGVFDKRLHHYAGDSDLTRRAQLLGWKSVWVQDVWVEHSPGERIQPWWDEDQATYKATWDKAGRRR